MVVAVLAAATMVNLMPASADDTFTAKGDAELVSGMQIEPEQFIQLAPAPTGVQVALPGEVASLVKEVLQIDGSGTTPVACPTSGRGPVFLCSAPSGATITTIEVHYNLASLQPPDVDTYPKSFPVTLTDLATKSSATVTTTIRAYVDLAIEGPYAAAMTPSGAGILVFVTNRGPSLGHGYLVTITITGPHSVVWKPPSCAEAGSVITCRDAGILDANQRAPINLALGTDSGAVQVSAQVTAVSDDDPEPSNNSAAGGPWVLFPSPGGVPPAPVPPAPGVPAPVAAPRAVATSPSETAGDRLVPPAPRPASATGKLAAAPVAAGLWTSPFVHYLAVAFLCGSTLYLLVGGAFLLRSRRRRFARSASRDSDGDLEIDLDRLGRGPGRQRQVVGPGQPAVQVATGADRAVVGLAPPVDAGTPFVAQRDEVGVELRVEPVPQEYQRLGAQLRYPGLRDA